MSNQISFTFQVNQKCSKSLARTGILKTTRGDIQTPVFMPIGTLGSVKGITNSELETMGSEIILGNTYHLWLQPGNQILQEAGGLHKFNDWQRPILTDSGGFQAFSLGKVKFLPEGVVFRSHRDGRKLFLSPEYSIQIQANIGSDIMLVLDQALAAEVTYQEAKKAMYLTRKWAQRSFDQYTQILDLQKQGLYPIDSNKPLGVVFGIPQGAQFPELRRESARLTQGIDFAGYSIGGVANGGEPEEVMYTQVLAQTEILENSKPRHLLGVGTPKDIVQMVARGIDMFDCVYPTRVARHGTIFQKLDEYTYESIKIKSRKHANDFEPINPNSKFSELRNYSKAYLRHLFASGELLAKRLATLNNLEFYMDLMQNIRDRVDNQSFENWWAKYSEISTK